MPGRVRHGHARHGRGRQSNRDGAVSGLRPPDARVPLPPFPAESDAARASIHNRTFAFLPTAPRRICPESRRQWKIIDLTRRGRLGRVPSALARTDLRRRRLPLMTRPVLCGLTLVDRPTLWRACSTRNTGTWRFHPARRPASCPRQAALRGAARTRPCSSPDTHQLPTTAAIGAQGALLSDNGGTRPRVAALGRSRRATSGALLDMPRHHPRRPEPTRRPEVGDRHVRNLGQHPDAR